MHKSVVAAVALVAASAAPGQPAGLPSAIYTDPPANPSAPARMEVLHIPSGSVSINGVAYLAAGPGAHPTVVICHGLPGNEKNLDLAQAVRRAGWNAITFNYRGSWGSPGTYRFAQNPQDAAAVLAFLRIPANAARYGIDTNRIALIGHSMGGWVSASVGGADNELIGVGLISAANLGREGSASRVDLVAAMADSMESLAGTTPEAMADEAIANRAEYNFLRQAPGLVAKPVLILSSDDGFAPHTDDLAAALRASGARHLATRHVATDHSWSDRRILLQSLLIEWLNTLKH